MYIYTYICFFQRYIHHVSPSQYCFKLIPKSCWWATGVHPNQRYVFSLRGWLGDVTLRLTTEVHMYGIFPWHIMREWFFAFVLLQGSGLQGQTYWLCILFLYWRICMYLCLNMYMHVFLYILHDQHYYFGWISIILILELAITIMWLGKSS